MIGLSLPAGPLEVVCLAAHPDDVEIGGGGLLLSLAARGQVTGHWLTLTGSRERTVEAEHAADAFLPGSSTTFLGLPDGRLPQYWGEVKEALHAFGGTRTPDLVLAPRPDDAHQDHRLLGTMAPTVWRDALVLHYEIPKWDGDLGRPNVYVPVADELARRKCELLQAHYPSQRERDWWDDEYFFGFLRMRGVEARTRYAEAFTVAKATLAISPTHG